MNPKEVVRRVNQAIPASKPLKERSIHEWVRMGYVRPSRIEGKRTHSLDYSEQNVEAMIRARKLMLQGYRPKEAFGREELLKNSPAWILLKTDHADIEAISNLLHVVQAKDVLGGDADMLVSASVSSIQELVGLANKISRIRGIQHISTYASLSPETTRQETDKQEGAPYAWCFIITESGEAPNVKRNLEQISTVKTAVEVFGGFNVIAELQGNYNQIGLAVVRHIPEIRGVLEQKIYLERVK